MLGAATLALGAVGAWIARARAPAAPQLIPDVTFTTIEGRRLPLSQLRGRMVLVDFWATSCAICLREMPGIAAIHRRLAPRGLVTIAVAMSYDRPDFVLHYMRSNALPFPVALDPMGEIAAALGPVRGTPTLLLIDPEGRLVRRIEGETDLAALERSIERGIAQVS